MIASDLARLRAFAASTDGSLLDDATWSIRHRRITQLCVLLTAFTLVFAAVDNTASGEWISLAGMIVLVAVASIGRLPRRVREFAAAGTFALAQLFLSRYVGNASGLAVIWIIVLTFYQDWVPIFVCCVASLASMVVAGIAPELYLEQRGFQAEVPLTGAGLRSLAIVMAATLALLVWRYGTQFARDQLTGTLSRAGAERMLDQQIARGRRPVAWVCDIDNFIAINAELGSAAGDQLLQHVAAQLRRVAAETLPNGHLCARLRADTFLVAAFTSPGDDFVNEFAHRVEFEAGVPATGIALEDIPVRLSVGATIALSGESGADLIRAAECAMRRAKGQGSVRVVVDQDARRRRSESDTRAASLLMSEIYRGCEHGEFELYLQPVVSIADGRPLGAEALVRWNHPGRGVVSPEAFLHEAERDSALMARLSHTLGMQFAESVSGLVDRHGTDWLPYGYAFNLAAIRFRDPMLVAGMAQMLALTGRDDLEGCVTLEVTEGALMDIKHRVPEILAQLRSQGYRIALDDFGVGHSSLAHLRDFPLDCVKIDQSFAQSVDHSPMDRAVVQAVSDIAAASGLCVVAEGVETESQREILRSINPRFLCQGYLFAKPMPVDEFEAWVGERVNTLLAVS